SPVQQDNETNESTQVLFRNRWRKDNGLQLRSGLPPRLFYDTNKLHETDKISGVFATAKQTTRQGKTQEQNARANGDVHDFNGIRIHHRTRRRGHKSPCEAQPMT
ncbi:unnamed protein product, partial [Ectocarpus fasciculatus]